MKRILIPLCLVLGTHWANAQRSYQFDSPERLFVEGKELFALKNYTGCMDKLEAYKHHATDADWIQEADYMLAYAAFNQGLPTAGEQLEAYLHTYPDSRHTDVVNYLMGSFLFGKGEYEEALDWLRKADVDLLSADEQEAYTFRLAYALLQTGERDKAYAYFARIQEIGDKYRDASAYYVAYIDYANGKYNRALVEFDALKDWVNDLADGEEIVEHRLSFSMLRPILATFVITGGCLAVAVLAPETYWLIAAVPLLYWAVVLGIRGRKLGTRAAFCEMIYLAFATAAALSLITIFIWLLLIYAAILLLGYLTSGSGSSSSSSSSDDDDARDESVDTSRCCGTCLHHGTANCPASGPEPDYYSGPCGKYRHYQGFGY